MLLQGKLEHKASNSYFYFQTQHIQNMHRDRLFLFVCLFFQIQILPNHLFRIGCFFYISSKIALRNFCPFFLQSYCQACPSCCIIRLGRNQPYWVKTGKMSITVTTRPVHNSHRCQSSWAVWASSSEVVEEVSESHRSVWEQQGQAAAPG